MIGQLMQEVMNGDFKSISRCISFIENGTSGYEELLRMVPNSSNTGIIGITGPPGAGKSTIVDALIGSLISKGKKVGVLCVDPSSPFNMGALLGDRIRMSEWYSNPQVFIRSLASRGSLGGLNPKIIEITELMKAAPFDNIIVETVGVGQSEVEIAGLADITVVVLVPEGGDEVQTMKAGLMEIADIFVVNKSDRPDADLFVKNLRMMLAPTHAQARHEIPIIKTVASQKLGIDELYQKLMVLMELSSNNEKKLWLLTERAFQIIQSKRMKSVDKSELQESIELLWKKGEFNLYSFAEKFV